MTYKIDNFSRQNQSMQSTHHFFDAGVPIPPMDVEKVNVGGAQFLEGFFDRDMHGLGVVSDIHNLLLDRIITILIRSRVLEKGFVQ